MSTKEGRRQRADVTGKINGLEIKMRFWLEKDKQSFLAEGRIKLLKQIREQGSISEAAKSMGLSYNHAWKIVKTLNSLSEKPVVVVKSGGAGGGGAKLTAHGEKLIKLFETTRKKLIKAILNL